jgi:L-cystine uptake protein TcyP (sodium:dicarboxylate symporter family)
MLPYLCLSELYQQEHLSSNCAVESVSATHLPFVSRIDLFRCRSFLPAFAMGFGTGSSAATMPVTMQCAIEHGCQEGTVSFVIPLGTSVNRSAPSLCYLLMEIHLHAVPFLPPSS